MKKHLFTKLIASIFLSLLIFTSCDKVNEKQQYSAYSMDCFDTVITIVGYEESKEKFDEIADEALAEFEEYHRLYTIYHRFEGLENLCTINELVDGEHRTVTVDKRIIDMLLYAKDMYYLTDGTVNVAMGSVLSLWHDYRSIGMDDPVNASLPPMGKLKEASLHMDIENIVIDEENSTVTITDPLTKLDVGAIAKGYATEQIARRLEAQGVTGYVLNVGGNVRTIGSKKEDTPWTVGLENPDGGEYIEYLHLDGQSVVTSGSYQRFYYVDGKNYHHIIHPDTLMPAEGYLSVSVICKDSGLGDALSTALFCMEKEKGLSLVEAMPGVEVLWVSDDGSKTASSGWNDYVKK